MMYFRLKDTLFIFSLLGLLFANHTVLLGQEPDEATYPRVPESLLSFDYKEINGEPRSLEDFRGKVILVNIWATWCSPCRLQIPQFVKLQKLYSEHGFEVVGLNVGRYDGKPEKDRDIRKVVADLDINYKILRSSKEGTGAYYKISQQAVVPQSILIDRDGRIRGVFVGQEKRIDEAIEKAVTTVMNEGRKIL